ncbi:MAG: PEP-CTERM sorting domain-containing protein [Verrucomicrobiae bacterium]|nr:PEP-CTERM sorting domain-containing protein [Verrucomicrobiae bacterium]
MQYRPFGISISLLAATTGMTLMGAQTGFVAPSWRGSAGTEYQSWEVFSVATDNGEGNRPDQPGSVASATITQHAPEAFLTGTGNIYNPATVSSFTVSDTAAEPVGLVWFQARTLGSEIDYSTVRLSYDLGSGVQFLTTTRIENDRNADLGASVSSLWQWNLTGLGVTSYEITFAAADSSLSFDSATLDTQAASVVPEPSTWALLVIGSLGLGAVVRRSRRG